MTEEHVAMNGDGKKHVHLTVDDDEISINSNDLRVDVGEGPDKHWKFEKARSVKPVKHTSKEPGYVWMMPYCQVCCVAAFVLAIVFLVSVTERSPTMPASRRRSNTQVS
ncbi:uncharacterized protein LOC134825155 [Bolinopsis microptera]|uniref:uncharacterized protein LOC134825155 n=1 Tax=Bolinopsis microptera TaxID=2820187 RepID=UPI0030799B96